MTEREAWLYLAKQWDKTGRRRATASVYGRTAVGLCGSIVALDREGKIDSTVAFAMRCRIVNQGHPPSYPYLWPCTLGGAKKRAAFCRRQAKTRRG